MTLKVQGFIIKKLPYGDNSAILKVFTGTEGLMSFMVHGVQRRQGSNAPVSQLMNAVELIYYPAKNSGLNRVKEIQTLAGQSWVAQDPVKTQILLFCAELLHHVLQDNAPDPELFNLLLHFFDSLGKGYKTVHHPLWFILHLLKNQGIEPNLDLTGAATGFDPVNGNMVFPDMTLPPVNFLSREGCSLAVELLNIQLSDLNEFVSDIRIRQSTFDLMLIFCQLHLLHGKKLKSVEIIREVLRS